MTKIEFRKLACVIAVFCVATAVASHAQTYSAVASFDATNGENPWGSLVQGEDGNFYGVTETGGLSNGICPQPEGIIGAGCGVLFKVTPGGEITGLYEFCAYSDCSDGGGPAGSLVLGTDGSFYGVTAYGGSQNQGTVFKITPSGAFTTLYSFCSQTNCTDGATPNGGLVQGVNGNFYGTTYKGGANQVASCVIRFTAAGCGTVFEITPAGKLTTVYSFCAQPNCADGALPSAGLVLGANGSFYGTTYGGGVFNTNYCQSTGCGTVFAISAAAQLTTLHDFCTQTVYGVPCADGDEPQTSLALATSGKLYGTTPGTIFSVTPTGTLTALYHFCAKTKNCADGLYPSNVVQATDGNFYGTSEIGGVKNNNCSEASSCGAIFKMPPPGGFSRLVSICQGTSQFCTAGAIPVGGLMQATNGLLYGTTFFGGTGSCEAHGNGGCGVVFSLSMGLGPFVQAVSNFGKPGQAIGILGNGLTGATGVMFDGVTAPFVVESDTFIQATVPSGTRTGKIEVMTPGGTLTSNVAFRILQ